MSNTIYGITAKKIKATLNGAPIEIRLGTFVCMANDLEGWGDSKWKSRAQRLCSQRETNYAKVPDAKFFTDHVNIEKGVNDLLGSLIKSVPENYNGTHDEYYFDNHESTVGTLLKDANNKWYIETDLQIIECIRRSQDKQKMEAGRLSYMSEVGSNWELRKAQLEEEDAKSETGMITRGHGLDGDLL